MLKVVDLALEGGFDRVVVKGESLTIINVLKGTTSLDWRFQTIIKDAKETLKDLENIQF